MPQSGGHWKAANNDIVERRPDGRDLTPMAMTNLIARYRTALDQHLADKGRAARWEHIQPPVEQPALAQPNSSGTHP
ncbi:MAG: hypothetical protein ACYDC7_11335 [Acidithiobacillus ferrivorans]